MDALEILHKHSANVAWNFGREWCCIGLKIGVIGALQRG